LIDPETGRLRFGIKRPQPPRPREFAGFSGSILGSGREVSAPTDWVAVGESRANSSLEEIPVQQGKYREILQNLMLLAESELSFLSISMAVATDSL
jgi:hypothetical protein